MLKNKISAVFLWLILGDNKSIFYGGKVMPGKYKVIFVKNNLILGDNSVIISKRNFTFGGHKVIFAKYKVVLGAGKPGFSVGMARLRGFCY